MDSNVPDHSVLSRFRTALTKHKSFDELLYLLNNQLEGHGVMVHSGTIVDASLSPTPRKPKGKKTYDLAPDGTLSVAASYQKGVDTAANWTKKGGKLCYESVAI